MPSNPPYDDDWSGESRNLETGSVRFSEHCIDTGSPEERVKAKWPDDAKRLDAIKRRAMVGDPVVGVGDTITNGELLELIQSRAIAGELEAALAQKTREYDKLLADAKHGEEMYIAMRNRCANTEAQVEQLGRQVAEMDAERRLLWTALTDVVSVERVNALSDAVLASRARTK